MSNEVPERVKIELDEFFAHLTGNEPNAAFHCIVSVNNWDKVVGSHQDHIEYIRADIAQAQTNAKVREVLLQILSSVENDSHIDVLVGINKLLNEYPDLSTNEEEEV